MRRTFILVGLGLVTIGFLVAAVWTMRSDDAGKPSTATLEPLPGGEPPVALRLTVTRDGIAMVTAEDLRHSLLAFDAFSADSLSLTRDGEPVPFYVTGEDEEAILYFYAEAMTDTLDAPAVYWLTAAPGVAMATRDVKATGDGTATGEREIHWEQNTTFLAQANGSDVWLGPRIFAPDQYVLPLDNIIPTGDAGKLTVNLWSNNAAAPDPDHHLRILVNDQEISDHYWEGITQETISADIPAGLLRAEGNTVTFDAPGDTGAAGEAIYLDWVEVTYTSNLALDSEQIVFTEPATDGQAQNLTITNADETSLLFDITDKKTPVALKNATLAEDRLTFAGSNATRRYVGLQPDAVNEPKITIVPEWEQPLRTSDGRADYIAIIGDGARFDNELQPLLDHREAQGLSTMVVPLQQIYDEFAHGRQSPDAIRDFLAYAVNEWETGPRFVLLVGDASYDTYDFEKGVNKNLLPSYLVYTEYAGHVASDTLFGIFDEGSLAPQVAIGRFPVQNARQLRAIVEKTIAYESADAQDWQGRALLVADDEDHFNTQSDILATELDSSGYDVQKLYMTENEDIRDAIMGAINHGVGIINYVGHGSVRVWGDEKVFQVSDVPALENDDRLPIFTTFTCLNGYFNHPHDDALAETLLWREDGGVVAAIAPSGRSLPRQQQPLADAFYDLLLSAEATTLGEALQAAKVASSGDSDLGEVIHTFNLLGDPALQFQLPAK
jgi:hypothetical protein